MEEMHMARYGGFGGELPYPLWGHHHPTSTCSTEALCISLFKRFYNPVSSPAPLFSPLQSLGWVGAESSHLLMTCLAFLVIRPILRLSTKPALNHHTSKDSSVFQRASFWTTKDTLNTQCLGGSMPGTWVKHQIYIYILLYHSIY